MRSPATAKPLLPRDLGGALYHIVEVADVVGDDAVPIAPDQTKPPRRLDAGVDAVIGAGVRVPRAWR